MGSAALRRGHYKQRQVSRITVKHESFVNEALNGRRAIEFVEIVDLCRAVHVEPAGLFERVFQATKPPYPIVSMYYLVGQNPELILGPRRDKPVRQTPITIRDGSGRVVHSGMSDIYAEDARLTKRLTNLYAEMLRRDPNDPYVTYVGAMRKTDPKTRVARLKVAAGRGGMELFKAPLLTSLVAAHREAGDMSASRQAEGELRAYIVGRGRAPTARLFRLAHPEIFSRG